MKKIAAFVSRHINDDTARLILDKGKWPEIDMNIVVNSIESRRKLKGKVKEWYENQELVFPARLSAEQCSSSATGRYKAELAENIAAAESWKLADLTGGLGVDSWFFSQKAAEVLYNEMQPGLCKAASYNFDILKAHNIYVSNHAVTGRDCREESSNAISPAALLSDFRPDIVYMDPARRAEGGRKVFLIEECSPDVISLKDEIFDLCPNILIKLSPMADISMVCERLGSQCREVHIVAAGGECKELLIWMNRDWNKEYSIKAIEIHNDGRFSEFAFTPSEEALSNCEISSVSEATLKGTYLFEPGKALMKSGAFRSISGRFAVSKLGISTHYYLCNDSEKLSELQEFGKVFKIMMATSLDKKGMRLIGKAFPKAEVSARNVHMDSESLRKKTGVASGGDAHIFGLKSDVCGNILIAASRIYD